MTYLKMKNQNFIGIEIGGTKLQLASADESLKIEKLISLPIDQSKGAKGILKQIEDAITELIGDKNLSAIGVGFGGPVSYKTGIVNISHQVEGWENFNLHKWLQEITGAQIFIDNDANIAALGEAIHGTGAN